MHHANVVMGHPMLAQELPGIKPLSAKACSTIKVSENIERESHAIVNYI
jgi:hypothetical protein